MQQKTPLNKLGIDCIFNAGIGDTSYIKMRNHWLDKIPKGLLHIYDVQQKMECPPLNKLVELIVYLCGYGDTSYDKIRHYWLDKF